ncbi:MAG: DEAD/DEAH box helicase [Clostridium sp.]|uniref:DEAD/DEAH box helicase n=1 Tax=Clostridium sp. TaxID=1506 RepID=UPI002FC8566F
MGKEFKDFNLDINVVKALENMGYNSPTKVQEETIGIFLSRRDLVVKSKTGSGKTASFGIPLCSMVNSQESKVQGLILVPTRELALQVQEEISDIGRLNKVRAVAVFGKQPFHPQAQQLKQRVHIVVGTPGRVMDHINRGTLDLTYINSVVIDEADKMLNMGFISQVEEILDSIKGSKNLALYSATMPEEIKKICNKYMNNPEDITIEGGVETKSNIKEGYIVTDKDDKLFTLLDSIYASTPEACIVFCNTKDRVKEVYSFLRKKNILTAQIHGDMMQGDRLKTMERFKNKEYKVLVATDVAARGIHIDHISHVYNYEIPFEKESYVHRIGRTGRNGNHGEAISIITENAIKYIEDIAEYTGKDIVKIDLPSKDEILDGKEEFDKSQQKFAMKTGVEKKKVHSDVVKIHVNGGKKKKIRTLDIVGCFSNLEGVTGADIGIIDIQDGHSYVDILNGKGKDILRKNREVTIKGKKVSISNAKK